MAQGITGLQYIVHQSEESRVFNTTSIVSYSRVCISGIWVLEEKGKCKKQARWNNAIEQCCKNKGTPCRLV